MFSVRGPPLGWWENEGVFIARMQIGKNLGLNECLCHQDGQRDLGDWVGVCATTTYYRFRIDAASATSEMDQGTYMQFYHRYSWLERCPYCLAGGSKSHLWMLFKVWLDKTRKKDSCNTFRPQSEVPKSPYFKCFIIENMICSVVWHDLWISWTAVEKGSRDSVN